MLQLNFRRVGKKIKEFASREYLIKSYEGIRSEVIVRFARRIENSIKSNLSLLKITIRAIFDQQRLQAKNQ